MVEARPKIAIKPDKCYWVIVKNRRYDELRAWPGFEGFQDINQVEDDAKNVKAGFRELGANVTEILIFSDSDFDEFV